MKRKATLLIKRLHTIYTMKEEHGSPCLIYNGYIAIHHDLIIAIGEGSYEQWVDSDTRIIDGLGHFAMPSFIECNAVLPSCNAYDLPRVQSAYLYEKALEGTLLHNFHQSVSLIRNNYYEIVQNVKENTNYPIIPVKDYLQKHRTFHKKRFCISTYDAKVQGGSQLLMARLLKLTYHIDDDQLMKSLTVYPAHRLRLTHVGVFGVGKQADILIIKGVDNQHLFSSLEEQMIAHVIKAGVRIFPFILI